MGKTEAPFSPLMCAVKYFLLGIISYILSFLKVSLNIFYSLHAKVRKVKNSTIPRIVIPSNFLNKFS